MKIAESNNFKFIPEELKVLCDEKRMTCLKAARRADAISVSILGAIKSIYYFSIDVLAIFSKHFKLKQFTLLQGLTEKILQKQAPLLLAQRIKINELIETHFSIVDKNVTHLDEAEVICLGENHYVNSHRIHNGEMIDTLCEPNDLILVEHDDKGSYRSNQASFVKTPLLIKGWDINTKNTSEGILCLELIQPLAVCTIITSLITPILGFMSLAFTVYVADIGVQKIFNDIPVRNTNMCRKIDDHSVPDKRIYVIGGSDHFRPSKKATWLSKIFDQTNKEPQNIGYQQTLKFLKSKKFVILVPKK